MAASAGNKRPKERIHRIFFFCSYVDVEWPELAEAESVEGDRPRE